MIGFIQSWRRGRYIQRLVARGMALGRNVELNDGFFLDPSHCFLITIEDDVTFGPGVRVFAHDASSLKCLGKTRVGLVRLGRNCFVGAGAVILPGVTIGENSIIGANSVVSRSVPANEVWAGNPAVRILSVTDYAAMLRMRDGVDFPESDFRIGAITAERKQEMKSRLAKAGLGFMVP
jgi:maltose O-acetyltransferase